MKTKILSEDFINELRRLFDKHLDKFEISAWQTNQDILKNLFKISDDKHIQTMRHTIKDQSVKNLIASEFKDIHDEQKIRKAFINYQRGYLPISMHIDIPADNPNENGYTFLIPLTFEKNIQTVAWKQETNGAILDYWIEKINWSNKPKLNNIGKQLDLSNGYFFKPEIVNYIEVDGIGEWFKGNVFGFKRSQIHCSNNFRNYGIPYKDYIVIQTEEMGIFY